MVLFFLWGLVATLGMLLVVLPGIYTGGVSDDAGMVFSLSALGGIPAWLIVAALTAMRWRRSSTNMVVLYNTPGVAAAVLWAMVRFQWGL